MASNQYTYRRRAATVLALLVPAVTLWGGTPAHATPTDDTRNVIELSADGVNYSRSIDELFRPAMLVPGDEISDSFWVRNAGEDPAYLTVQVVNIQIPDAELRQQLSLAAAPVGGTPSAYPLVSENGCVTVHAGSKLGTGDTTELSTALLLGDLAGAEGQGGKINFAFRMILSEAPVSEQGSTSCVSFTNDVDDEVSAPAPDTNNTGNGLAITGSSSSAAFVALGALAALAAGGILTMRRRRGADSPHMKSFGM